MFPGIIGNIGTTEIIIILVIALLLFGRRLPEVGRSLGKGIVEFKKGLRGVEEDLKEDIDEADRRIDLIGTRENQPMDLTPRKKEETPEKGS